MILKSRPGTSQILCLSSELKEGLLRLLADSDDEMFLVGGAVRDILTGRKAGDIDIAVNGSAEMHGRKLQRYLQGGTLVDLSGPEDEAYRLVLHGEQVDISSFRSQTTKIEDDLGLRDFTVNAMAVPLWPVVLGESFEIIDPYGGAVDLQEGRLVHCPDSFPSDPVRMVRGYRLMATFELDLVDATRKEVRRYADLIVGVASERVSAELWKIFRSNTTHRVLWQMHQDGLLQYIFPELYKGYDVTQPGSHHLDVFEHSFETLRIVEEIIRQPGSFFVEHLGLIDQFLAGESIPGILKWAALFHDMGKPETRRDDPAKMRITFYGHDEAGKKFFVQMGRRLKFSRSDSDRIAGLIGMHMHPFHLCNTQRDVGPVSRRAILKICQRADQDLIGLFLLSMSDSLASSGELKPVGMEQELLQLFKLVLSVYQELIDLI